MSDAATVPVLYGMGSPDSYPHEFGIGEGNCIGYVKTRIWPARKTPGLDDRWEGLTKRIAELVAADPECQRILLEEVTSPTDAKWNY